MTTIQQQVDDIQNKLYGDKHDYENYFLEYATIGSVESVSIVILENDAQLRISLWNSENEERRWVECIDDYEPFEVFLKRRIKESIKSLKIMLNRL